ncbi:MAG: glucose 1-dehydrogenase [Peptococcaceae bacterium]|jgi:gluconate 5-dehydrogenase|nr:glucose 1-dehydrogenase [Peptococcaceae bacterium]MDH7526371.1 glucose 1-dehydrogenase [Peptococcaceae bacterium]
MNLFDLSGKKAVVIGGGGGIGRAIAAGLAGHGAEVGIASRNLANLEEAAAEIKAETGKDIKIFQVDSADEASVKALVKAALDEFGTIDILVNSQGYNLKSPALEFPMDEWDKLFKVNVKGFMICCQEFGRVMVEKKSGKIINVSSVRGIRANAGGNSAYCASKGAVDMITRTLAAEWAPYNVKVNAIGPALIATKLTEKQMKEPGRTQNYLKNIPLGRLGETRDVVGAAVFLASEASDFVTGQIIYVDGGLTAIG